MIQITLLSHHTGIRCYLCRANRMMHLDVLRLFTILFSFVKMFLVKIKKKTIHCWAKPRYWPMCGNHVTAVQHYTHIYPDVDLPYLNGLYITQRFCKCFLSFNPCSSHLYLLQSFRLPIDTTQDCFSMLDHRYLYGMLLEQNFKTFYAFVECCPHLNLL